MTSATVGTIDIVAWFVYLFSAVMFVVGLHFMNSPKTARKGNQISAFGMVVAALMAFVVLFAKGFVNIVAVVVLVVGILIGAVAGVVSAKKVKMTDMPQLVSVFNTVGGGAAALVALNDILTKDGTPDIVVLITAGLGILIGSVTFTGSLIAAGKLQGIKWVKKLALPGKGVWNILFAVLSIASLVMLCVQPEQRLLWSILTTVFALCYGLVFVIPIGGADMPVVISVLNACTGTAVAMSGLAIDNVALIVAGALVGSAGVTLSILMAQAMNRPLISVLAGGFGGGSGAAAAGDGPEGTMKETTPDDLAVQLVYAEKVIFVPGFGLAQAQAQRELADLGELLKSHGVEVSYAIHPVAGRMPGHMNVLLAEANVPYEELVDLDEINPQFPQANVALVVGANDVTNPAARRPGTPVSGMPILDVDKAQNVVVMKRGRGMGYAGIQNELYFEDNTQMLFGDAKKSLQAVIAAVKELLA
ncbi:NAD(P) transhydrogenase beta subunit [Bifidobacterium saguini DSM 23967]|uniref:NAD(P) transhydrogenase subunit beta n=3 Tax=Bifidobacterium TaxID=1678 RepID=A0A2N5IQ95_9BIFI|nr:MULTISPECIES: NAD(P)(+) transhydrogenase (Re/Si-specific) subunit beta [Bifidobacterium]KFI92332.1 NAD(P) transhydrogenase beta subunit [Bifidobacterium saguini DSM 23967]PLS24122.1 NAD(P) transhydrogenase subunit beta [Bifidobacterium imperatoris]QSY57378.1 NAD(P)(+) transhydrogenase (Re/Si-specific) subunit beta [Bifidobacterium imperatoris]QTB91032.1 NAD(P)(+) transhydrogenase (Re/Si-specific) subunit beta [Bifidobacterium saguini]